MMLIYLSFVFLFIFLFGGFHAASAEPLDVSQSILRPNDFSKFSSLYRSLVKNETDTNIDREFSGDNLDKLLKIFVYPLADGYVYPNATVDDMQAWEYMYSHEFIFYEKLLQSEHRTSNPEDADYFLVPAMVTWHMHRGRPQVGFGGGLKFLESVREAISQQFPYWNASAGKDHVWLIAQDIGSCLSPVSFSNAIFLQSLGQFRYFDLESILKEDQGLVSNAEFEKRLQYPCYSSHKDIVIPPYVGNPVALEKISSFLQGKIGKRKTLAYFRGSIKAQSSTSNVYSSGVRQWLYNNRNSLHEHWNFEIHDSHLPNAAEYLKEMSQSTFCLSPPGWVAWSPRMFQAIAVFCIPVLIGPPVDLPFGNLGWLSYNEFTIRIGLTELSTLPELLSNMSSPKIEEMQKKLMSIWRYYTYNSDNGPATPDAFDLIIQSLQEKLGRNYDDDIGVAAELSQMSLMEVCTILPKNVFGGKIETVVSLNPDWLKYDAQKHAETFGLTEYYDVVEEHVRRQTVTTRFRKLETKRSIISKRPHCVLLSTPCSSRSELKGNCMELTRQLVNLRHPDDFDFLLKTRKDRILLSTLIVTYWVDDTKVSAQIIKALDRALADFGKVLVFLPENKWSQDEVTIIQHEFLLAGFCITSIDDVKNELSHLVVDHVLVENWDSKLAFQALKQSKRKTVECSKAEAGIIDKGYVVNLERRKDKWEEFISHRESINIGVNLQRFVAVDGRNVAFTHEIRDLFNFKSKKLSNPHEDHGFRRGVLGCSLSHLQIWGILELREDLKDTDAVIILEDDAEFVENFESKWEQLLKQTMHDPRWDLLYLGFSDDNNIHGNIMVHPNVELFSMTPRSYGGGTFGYIIRKRGAKILRERARSVRIAQPIDWFMIESFVKGSVIAYKRTPHLIKSTPIQANGSNTYENYPLYSVPMKCARRKKAKKKETKTIGKEYRPDGGGLDSISITQPLANHNVAIDSPLKAMIYVKPDIPTEEFASLHECSKVCFSLDKPLLELTSFDSHDMCKLLWDHDELHMKPAWFDHAKLPSTHLLFATFFDELDNMIPGGNAVPINFTAHTPVTFVILEIEKKIVLNVPNRDQFLAAHAASVVCITSTRTSGESKNVCITTGSLPSKIKFDGPLTEVYMQDVTGFRVVSISVKTKKNETLMECDQKPIKYPDYEEENKREWSIDINNINS